MPWFSEQPEPVMEQTPSRVGRLVKRGLVLGGATAIGLVIVATIFRGRPVPPDGEVLPESPNREVPAHLVRGPRSAGPSADTPVPETYEGLKEESLALGARLVQRYPDAIEALDLLASMHDRFGNLAEATRCWHQWLDRHPESAEAYFRLGRFAREKGKHEEAAEYLEKAFRRAPSLPGVQIHLGESLMTLAKMDEAVAVLEADVDETRNNPNRFLLLGHARLQAQQYEKAKDAFRRVVELAPEMTHAYFGLATACAKLGQAEEAKKHFDEFAKRKDREIAADRADVLQNDLPAVRQVAAVWYVRAGELFERAGDEAEAEAHWLRAGAIHPADKESRQSLLRLYQRQGRADRVARVEEELRKIVSQQGSLDDRKGR